LTGIRPSKPEPPPQTWAFVWGSAKSIKIYYYALKTLAL
jgi:hypothetical protein